MQSAQDSVMKGWDGAWGGREVQEGGDACVLTADSHSHTEKPAQPCKQSQDIYEYCFKRC